jgi:hypothetical protein
LVEGYDEQDPKHDGKWLNIMLQTNYKPRWIREKPFKIFSRIIGGNIIYKKSYIILSSKYRTHIFL